MESVKAIIIPVIADSVLSSDIYYGNDITGIYFQHMTINLEELHLISLMR